MYVGRLPFRYRFQVAPVVDKIIEYELHADDSWFKTGAVVSGNTYPPSRGGKPEFNEGELATGKTVAMLESAGFTMEKLWLSIPGSWNGPQDIIDMISKGKGFIHFAGHSNPAAWGNYRPYDDIYGEEYVNGLHIWDMHKFANKGKYPVVVLGGCHSAQFNVTLAHMIPHIKQYGFLGYFFTAPHRFYYMEWVPVDLSSRFVLVPESGAIACMGHAGLGYGSRNENWNRYSYWIEPRFFEIYANQSYGYEHLGDIHSQAIIDYLTIIGGVNKPPHVFYDGINRDRKTVEGWVLLGDPSLQVGGI